MIKSQKTVLIVLFIPILALLALTFYKRQKFLNAVTVTLPINPDMLEDGRDIVWGYPLRYKIQYGVESICQPPVSFMQTGEQNAYICLKPKIFSYQKPDNCHLMIKGFCIDNEFHAGVEHYQIPEDYDVEQLKRQINSGDLKIVLVISKDGKAMVRDVLFPSK